LLPQKPVSADTKIVLFARYLVGGAGSVGTPDAIPHQRDKILIQPVFRDATAGASAKSLRAGLVPLVSGCSNDARVRDDLEDLPNRSEARSVREIKIHQGHVGSLQREPINGLFIGLDHTNKLHIGLEANQDRKAFAEQWILIHCQDPYLA